ncbi:MAG TPA: hypothetical protein VGQ28_06085, partial [Thermoanaerobaculia bacterium]|nr:hypothetical protein [Thermoanaerobaculia bacterium]
MRRQLVAALILAGTLLPASSAHGQSPLPEVSPEAVVNTFTMGNQTAPAVGASASGTVWIAWIDGGQQLPGIRARRFDPSGAPLGPEIQVHDGLSSSDSAFVGPRIGATADGGSVVVWAETPNVWIRRFDRDGAPVGDEQRIPPTASFETITFPEVAVASDGSFVVAWLVSDLAHDTILAQRFNPQAQSLGTVQTVTSGLPNALRNLRLAGAADGGFLAVWQDTSQGAILARRYVGATGTGSAVTQVNTPGTGYAVEPAVVLLNDGSARVVWIADVMVWGRRLSAAGETASPVMPLGDHASNFVTPAIAAGKDGEALVVWSDYDLTLRGRLLKDDLTPLSNVFPAANPAFLGTAPALATTASGDLVLAWSSGFAFNTPFENPPPIAGRDGNAQGVAARIFAPLHCAAGSDVLCLGPNSRFEARVSWKNPSNGDTGTGHTVPLTADTGAFWFFGDQNLELMVKVLDGTSVNLRYWVYGGSLSNVEYTLTVNDTLTGVERTYHNPAGQFASLADIAAFPFGLSDTERAERTERTTATARTIETKNDAIVGCLPITLARNVLCLASGHFLVSVDLIDPRTGLAGDATAVPLTGDTGAFWFF